MHSVDLSSVYLRSASLESARWEKDWVISVSQHQGVNGSANSQQNVSFVNAGKLESLPIEQASLVM